MIIGLYNYRLYIGYITTGGKNPLTVFFNLVRAE